MTKKKAIVVYHRSDYDGVMSAAIAKHYLQWTEKYSWIEMLGFNYGDPRPDLDQWLKDYQTIVIADVTLVPDDMGYLADFAKDRVVWIDHHETAIKDSIDGDYDSLSGIRRSGTAACELCWEYFWHGSHCPMIIQYLGAWDVWDKNRFDWENVVAPLQFALKSRYGVSEYYISPAYQDLIEIQDLEPILNEGRVIKRFLEQQWKSAVKNYSFEITVAGKYRGIAIISTDFSSNVFGSVSSEYDIMCVVNKREDKYGISLYVDPSKLPEFSVGTYLKANYGGGGHKGAAGCTVGPDVFYRLLEDREI